MPRLVSRSTIFSALAVVAVVATSVVAWDWFDAIPAEIAANPKYVGRATCAECHQTEYHAWLGSDHDRAMDLATEKTVLADFNDTKFEYHGVTTRFFRRDGKFMVNTEGPDGAYHDYEIKYTFGVKPLQQYMVEFPDGRVQVLRESWDVKNKRWFFVTPPDVINERIRPGDPLHWTGIGQNWNTTCADCHSTDIHKNYDPETNTYHTTWQEINVGCEECHGPGSVHVDLARSRSLFWDRKVGYGLPSLKDPLSSVQLDMCAKCHSRRYQVHEDFRPGKSLYDHYEPVMLENGLYQADGQIWDEVYEYDSFRQSKMYANHVRCIDCHDPHTLKVKFTGNALCTQCHVPHNAGKYDTPAHHHHEPGTAGSLCISCHMPTQMYMVIDERRDHSFRLPRPDLSAALGTTNACNNCHSKPEETNEWAAAAIRKWFPKPPDAPPHWGPAIAAGRDAKPAGEKLLLDLIRRNTTPSVVKATAVDLLANYPSTASVAARRDALRDRDPQVRLAAVRSLPGDDMAQTTSDLAGMLDDPLRTVRIAAVSRLAHLPVDKLTSEQHKLFEQAMIEFRHSENLSLDHAGGHLALASLDREHNRIEEAIKHITAAIALEPYLAGPRSELASLMQQYGGSPGEIEQLRRDEVNLMERDAKLAPQNAHIFYQLGLLRYTLGELDAAEEAFKAACDKAPRNYEYRMALALLEEKRYEQTGESKYFDSAAEAIKAMHELNAGDDRAKQIFIRLMQTRKSREATQPQSQQPPAS
ncbi:MAG: multiheme c-type cytochrome [Pirellulales bacterium]